jgi:DNA-binding MarR family transcriptional regulator
MLCRFNAGTANGLVPSNNLNIWNCNPFPSSALEKYFTLFATFICIKRIVAIHCSMSEAKVQAIHQRFAALVKLAAKMEKLPRSWGTDEQLASHEIVLVETIGDHKEQLSVTDIAKALYVTKGAVSQSLKKLERKGLTSKSDDPANNSRSIVTLTAKGKTAYYAHKHWHETMDGGFREYFRETDEAKLDFLLEFLERTEDFFRRAMK